MTEFELPLTPRVPPHHAEAEIIVGKQRAGAVSTVQLTFQSTFVRFADLAWGH